jgi:peptidyl-prolyl cis-trans isomerase SurA
LNFLAENRPHIILVQEQYMRKIGLAILGICLSISIASAKTHTRRTIDSANTGPKHTLDKIAAVVGGSIILQSDIELSYASYLANGGAPNPAIKCQILQNLLAQKILGQQAIIDSIEVKDDDIDAEVDRRMRSSIQRAGGQDRLEQFLGRSVIQYKDEIRPDVKENMIADEMKKKITEKVNVTPQDVETYFNKIPKDSLPTFNKEVEVGEIVFQPQLNKEEKAFYKQKAEDLRTRVKNGEDFGTLARLYSQDPGSAPEGGDLGFGDRNSYVKEYSAWAFKLKAGEISPVFESDFGFHFLQVIERRGEQVHTRHILIVPAITQASLDRAKAKADSVYNLFAIDKRINASNIAGFFSNAASVYSDNKDTKFNGGMMLNAEDVQNRSTHIPSDKLDPQVALVIDTMKVGTLSKPQLFTATDGKKSYKILYLKSVTNAHKANLAQDFPKIKDAAYNDKISRTISEWFEKRRKETYIKIDPEFLACPGLKSWPTPVPVAASAD